MSNIVEKFKTGDAVKLKSGGPTMTVASYHSIDMFDHFEDSSQVNCVWFDKNESQQTGRFEQDMLEKVED